MARQTSWTAFFRSVDDNVVGRDEEERSSFRGNSQCSSLGERHRFSPLHVSHVSDGMYVVIQRTSLGLTPSSVPHFVMLVILVLVDVHRNALYDARLLVLSTSASLDLIELGRLLLILAAKGAGWVALRRPGLEHDLGPLPDSDDGSGVCNSHLAAGSPRPCPRLTGVLLELKSRFLGLGDRFRDGRDDLLAEDGLDSPTPLGAQRVLGDEACCGSLGGPAWAVEDGIAGETKGNGE